MSSFSVKDLQEAQKEMEMYDSVSKKQKATKSKSFQIKREAARYKVRWIRAWLKATEQVEASEHEMVELALNKLYPGLRDGEIVIYKNYRYQLFSARPKNGTRRDETTPWRREWRSLGPA